MNSITIPIEGMIQIDQMVADPAEVTEVGREVSANLLIFALRVSFLLWLKQRLERDCQEWDGNQKVMLADLRRQHQITSQKLLRAEGVLSVIQEVVERPLPDWMSAEMVAWASEARHEQLEGSLLQS